MTKILPIDKKSMPVKLCLFKTQYLNKLYRTDWKYFYELKFLFIMMTYLAVLSYVLLRVLSPNQTISCFIDPLEGAF